MRRTIIAAASLILLAACDNSAEPAPPPTSQDALTTATTAPPTPSDEVEVTTDAAPTTEEPAEAESQGPPEMPDEAREQTQEGAIVFVDHFVETVNYTGINPVPGLVSSLSSEDCQTCQNLEETVVYSAQNENFLDDALWEVTSEPEVLLFSDDGALVRLSIKQRELPVVNAAGAEVDRTQAADNEVAIDLLWADGWSVRTVEFG